jgi:hypothetical protein
LKSDTLRIDGSFGKTFWLTLILLLFLGGIGEWIARLEIFQAYLTPPRLGSRHSQLGYKLALLDAEVRKNGPVDCIAVGSSTIDVGFDPDAFQMGYQEVAGQDIRCFNFGIDASSSISAAVLTGILVEEYHPRLLIFGTDARDFAVQREDQDTAVVLDTPWIRYREGNFSLAGWLLDHSYLYRYRQHLGRLARFNFEGTLWSRTTMSFELHPDGFNPIPTVATYINDPPAGEDDSYEVVYYNRIYSTYRVLDENIAALERIMNYNGSEVKVIVVEMPISDGLYYFFGNGESDYNRFVTRVDELANLHQVPFWRTEPLDMIPDDGWSDYSHLNVAGAEIFSTWLGQQVGVSEALENRDLFQP